MGLLRVLRNASKLGDLGDRTEPSDLLLPKLELAVIFLLAEKRPTVTDATFFLREGW